MVMQSNRKALIGITVSVVGTFIGWAAYKAYQKKRNAECADDLQPCADSAGGEKLSLSCFATTRLDSCNSTKLNSCNLHQEDVLPSFSDNGKDSRDCDSELAIEENCIAVISNTLNAATEQEAPHSCESVEELLVLPSVSDKGRKVCDSELAIEENCIALESTTLNTATEQEAPQSWEIEEKLLSVSVNSKDKKDCYSELDIDENCIAVESTLLKSHEQESTQACDRVEELLVPDESAASIVRDNASTIPNCLEQFGSAQNECTDPSQSKCSDGLLELPNSQSELTEQWHSQNTCVTYGMSDREKNSCPPCAVITPQSQSATKTSKSLQVDDKTAENKGRQIKHAVGDKITTYRFIMPARMCGYFIGRNGVKIMALKKETNTNIKIGREPVLIHFRYCTVEGCEENVTQALNIVKQRYPNIDTTKVNEFGMPEPGNFVISPERMQLHLPFGIPIEAVVCHIVNAGHVFVQQPTHPSYNGWQRLADCMSVIYSNESAPQLPENVNEGVMCVAPGANSGWCRALLMSISEDHLTAHVKYVDVGGYANVPLADLRQIHGDFLALPFQAVECYMSNIEPANGVAFSEEADAMLNSMTSGHLVQVQCQAMAENAVPFIHIIAQTRNGMVVMVNRELAAQGLVRWYN